MNRDDFNSSISSLLDDAESIIPNENLPQLPFMKDAPDVHDWYDFEHRLWKKGEEIRELIKPFLNHNRSWIRNEAKRYINKCN